MTSYAAELTVEQAIAAGDDYMVKAEAAFAKADSRLRLEAAMVELEKANYLQTRALSYYQYASNAIALTER